jgi:hypothetical protein
MSAASIVYLLISVATAYAVSRQASPRYPIFVISVWLFCGPVIDSEQVLTIARSLGIHFNTTWVMLGLLLPFVGKRVVLGGTSDRPQGGTRGLLAWTIAYCLAAGVALAHNIPSIGQLSALISSARLLVLALFTWLACDVFNESDRRALYSAVVVFACYSAIVAIVQTVADESFLRLGMPDPLSSGITRVKGLFGALASQWAV